MLDNETYEQAQKILAAHDDPTIEIIGPDGYPLIGLVGRSEYIIERLRRLIEPPAFLPDDMPDKYRDLWNANMPRVSGCMYFAIPGEQPMHVEDDQALRIMQMLSHESATY